jgi:hypothetical protein
MKRILTIAALLFVPIEAFAKKSPDFMPPPYSVRASRSFIALLPVACVLGLALYFLHRTLDRNTCTSRRLSWIIIVFALVCAGSLLAATDWLNDEGWNPAFWGGPVIALMAPISLFVLNKRFSLPVKILLSIVVFPVFVILSAMGVMGLVWHVSRNALAW